MKCEELNARLLDYLEGELPAQDRAAAQDHLAECPACRAELDRLRAGADALRAAADELAPRQPYLTPERLQRLMAAREEQRRPIRLITLRRLVAAAAAAAIIAAAPFLIDDYRRLTSPAEETPTLAQAPSPGMALAAAELRRPTILAAMSHDAPMSMLRSVPPGPEMPAALAALGQQGRWAVADTPGLRVPVENVLYDPDESSHWW